MKAFWVQMFLIDPVSGATVEACFTSYNNPNGVYVVGGKTFYPYLESYPDTVISVFDGDVNGSASVSLPELEISANNKYVADLLGYVWDSCTVRVFKADPRAVGRNGGLGQLKQISEAVIKGSPRVEDAKLRVTLQDKSYLLEQDILTLTYAGTGGMEGPAAMAGTYKPLSLGSPLAVPLILVDAGFLSYQYHGYGPCGGVARLSENGILFGPPKVVVPFRNDAATTYADLKAVALTLGQWADCPSIGFLRLGGEPAANGVLCADVWGITNASGFVITSMVDVIAQISSMVPVPLPVDRDQFFRFSTSINGLGVSDYIDNQVSLLDLISRYLSGVGGYPLFNRQGVMTLGLLRIKASADLTLRSAGTTYPLLEDFKSLEVSAPYKMVRIGAQKCFTVHTNDQISSAVKMAFESVYGELEDAISDGRLNPSDKSKAIIALGSLNSRLSTLLDKYNDIGAPADVKTLAEKASFEVIDLSTYLDSTLTPPWNDTNSTSVIPDPAAYRNQWVEAESAVNALSAAITGRPGKDGVPGTNGLPGPPGPDGRTPYTHYAYANSLDGTIDFITGIPGLRAYEGRYTDYTEADSQTPASYQWREYKGPPFGMAARGNVVIAGNSVIKKAGTAADWDSDAYSTVGYRNGCRLSFTGRGNDDVMVGFNKDPATDSSFFSLDYAFYLRGDGLFSIYENGSETQGGMYPGYGQGRFDLDYDGNVVRYYYNDILVRELFAGPNLLLYMDSSFHTPGGRINNISFIPRGSIGKDGVGIPGAPGKDGRTSYLHLAYADNGDGSLGFSFSSAGKKYLGQYVDFTAENSGDHRVYAWSLIRGADGLNGSNGLPGPPGANGLPTYTHIAYSNSPDGSSAFSTTDPTGRAYVGFYVDQVEADSGDYRFYAWSLIKGDTGAQGNPGGPGAPGAPGPQGGQGNPGAPGAPGIAGTDGYGLIPSPQGYTIPSYATGSSKPAWKGGRVELNLNKGGQTVAAESYVVHSATNVSSIAVSGNVVTFADIVGDTASFVARANRGGFYYEVKINIVRSYDGSAAFQSSQPFEVNSSVASASGNTTVPSGRTMTISANADYLAKAGINCVGKLAVYWRNLTDNGPYNLVASADGSTSYNRSIGDGDYEGVYGSVSVSGSFVAPSPDKQIEYSAQYSSNNSGGYVRGVVTLQGTQ